MFMLLRERSVNIGLTLIQYFNVIIHTKLLYREEVAYGIRKKVIQKDKCI